MPPPGIALAGRAAPLVLALLLLPAGRAPAQTVLEGTERLDDDRPEAWAMRWFAAALAPGGYGPSEAAEPGEVELALEAGWLPGLSEAERRVGFGGTKVEDLDRTSVFARPRIRVGLPARLALEADWLPPIEIDGARANLLGLSLAGPIVERGSWRLGWRAGVQAGTIDGDFTCPAAEAAAGNDPVANPFGCEEASSDEVELESLIGEASLAYSPVRAPELALFLAARVTRLDSTFRVDARWSGFEDRTRLEHSGTDWGLRGGLRWDPAGGWHLAGELAWVPLDVVRSPNGDGSSENDPLVNFRVVLSRRLR